METYTVPRDGQRPLRFEGGLLADSDGKWVGGRDQNRYYDLAVYRASDGRYVAQWSYATIWQGETNHARAEVYASIEAVADALEQFDPCAWVVGFPTTPHYREEYTERQATLLARIREHYQAQVQQLCTALEVSAELPPATPPTAWEVRYDAALAELVLLGPGACEIVVRGFNTAWLTREHVVDEALLGSLEQLRWAYTLGIATMLELISTRDRAKLSTPVLHVLHLSAASWHLDDATAFAMHSVPGLDPEQAKRVLAWAEGRA